MEGFDWAIMSGLRHDPVESHRQTEDQSDVDTKLSQPRGEDGQRSDYTDEGNMNEDEDGQSTFDEYLATRGTFGSVDEHDSPRIPTTGSFDTTEIGSSGIGSQVGYANSRQNGRKGSTEYTSDEGAEKGWKQKYQEWKSKQVSIYVEREAGSEPHQTS